MVGPTALVYGADMATIQRLADSCLLVTTGSGTTLFDPGFFSWRSDEVDLDALGDVQRVLITHAHADHVHPDFVRWLVDRGDDVAVHANQDVVDLLAEHDVAASTEVPADATVEDLDHERLPNGATLPNRAWTLGGVFTHPGDSQQLTETAPVMALPLLAPWTSTTDAVAFARRVGPRQVVAVHDFYCSASGRRFLRELAAGVLAEHDIELLPLDWGDHLTI